MLLFIMILANKTLRFSGLAIKNTKHPASPDDWLHIVTLFT